MAIAAALVVVLVLSSREPLSPEGLPVIDSREKLLATVKQAFDIANPIVAKAERGEEPTMEEQKVNSVPLISDPQSFLASDKREIVAEFQKEVFEVPNQSLFELAF